MQHLCGTIKIKPKQAPQQPQPPPPIDWHMKIDFILNNVCVENPLSDLEKKFIRDLLR
jgi:hypothetical protein